MPAETGQARTSRHKESSDKDRRAGSGYPRVFRFDKLAKFIKELAVSRFGRVCEVDTHVGQIRKCRSADSGQDGRRRGPIGK